MNVIESVSIVGLKRTHLVQLANYIAEAERQGLYYGRKDHFDKRHEDLKGWMERTLSATAGQHIKESK